MSVIVLGHIIIETIVFPNGKVLTPVLGSPAAYSSMALARLGTHVCLHTHVGEDLPTEFVAVLRRTGVDLRGMQVTGKESTRNKLIYTTPENKQVEYMAKAPNMGIEDLPLDDKEVRLFYACPMDYEVPPQVIQEIARAGYPVVVDLGGYGGATSATHPDGRAEGLRPLLKLLPGCDLLKTSLEDCRYIFGDVGDKDGERRYADLLLRNEAKRVVVTRGSRGVYYQDEESSRSFPPLRCKTVDTTGAGDTFAAGMIHRYLNDSSDIEAMVQFGQATACCVIEKSGGVVQERMPTASEVEKKLRTIGG